MVHSNKTVLKFFRELKQKNTNDLGYSAHRSDGYWNKNTEYKFLDLDYLKKSLEENDGEENQQVFSQ